MSTTLDDKKTISDMVVAWIGVVALMIGAGWTINQYLDKLSKEKVQETLKYVHKFNSGELHKAQRDNSEFWLTKSSNMKKLHDAGDESALAKFIVTNVTNDNEAEQDIWLLIDFYESIAICVKQGICDKESAFAFFGQRSIKFYNLHHHYINYVRAEDGLSDANYALAMFDFSLQYYEK